MRAVVSGARPDRPEAPLLGDENGIPDRIWSMVESCWRESVDERPSGRQIVEALSGALKISSISMMRPRASHRNQDFNDRIVDANTLMVNTAVSRVLIMHHIPGDC
jgi:hypothetical protein